MKYSIVYESKTGNTALLAEALHHALPEGTCLYCGVPDAAAAQADVIFVGFWTDKGNCSAGVAAFLQTLKNRRIFLFGTAGFGESEAYFMQILARVQALLDGGCTVVGTFMCQGKMPNSVRERYEAMLPAQPEKMRGMLDNFDRALPHPTADDLENLVQAMQSCL